MGTVRFLYTADKVIGRQLLEISAKYSSVSSTVACAFYELVFASPISSLDLTCSRRCSGHTSFDYDVPTYDVLHGQSAFESSR
jgi:hypothetical protein